MCSNEVSKTGNPAVLSIQPGVASKQQGKTRRCSPVQSRRWKSYRVLISSFWRCGVIRQLVIRLSRLNELMGVQLCGGSSALLRHASPAAFQLTLMRTVAQPLDCLLNIIVLQCCSIDAMNTAPHIRRCGQRAPPGGGLLRQGEKLNAKAVATCPSGKRIQVRPKQPCTTGVHKAGRDYRAGRRHLDERLRPRNCFWLYRCGHEWRTDRVASHPTWTIGTVHISGGPPTSFRRSTMVLHVSGFAYSRDRAVDASRRAFFRVSRTMGRASRLRHAIYGPRRQGCSGRGDDQIEALLGWWLRS
jgi:hypothetical protein